MRVEQIDRKAAASGYYAWCSGNPVIPERMTAGTADDHSMVQAFARHREQAEREAVEKIVAWLDEGGQLRDFNRLIAKAIEAGEWKQ